LTGLRDEMREPFRIGISRSESGRRASPGPRGSKASTAQLRVVPVQSAGRQRLVHVLIGGGGVGDILHAGIARLSCVFLQACDRLKQLAFLLEVLLLEMGGVHAFQCRTSLRTNYQTDSAAGDVEVWGTSLRRNQLDADHNILAPD